MLMVDNETGIKAWSTRSNANGDMRSVPSLAVGAVGGADEGGAAAAGQLFA